MKKPIWVVLALLFCWGAGFAQYPNTPEAKISEAGIKQYLKSKNRRLPLYLHELGEFGAKKTLSALAQSYAQQRSTYNAYYNAAVIFFTPETFYGEDVNPSLGKEETKKVVEYASLAIDRKPNNSDMYLIRGLALYRFYGLSDVNGIFSREHALWIKKHEKVVNQILSDFKTVEKLKPQLAPYAEMAKLYRGLGRTKEAVRCEREAKNRQKHYRLSGQVKASVREGFQNGISASATVFL